MFIVIKIKTSDFLRMMSKLFLLDFFFFFFYQENDIVVGSKNSGKLKINGT